MLRSFLLASAFAFLSGFPAHAALRLPAILGDHLVLQAGQPDAVWGWADPGAKVTVAFVEDSGDKLAQATATAGSDGRWSLQLPALPAKSSGHLQVATDRGETKTIADVLVGQAWLASGQSNMDYRVHSQNTPPDLMALAQKEAAEANGTMRYFHVIETTADTPQDDVKGEWTVATPDTVGKCSAVAWYFGVRLREKLHQPIGLIVSSVGGTPAETWIPKADVDATPAGPAIEKRQADRLAAYPQAKAKYAAEMPGWLAQNPTPELQSAHFKSKPPDPTAGLAHNKPGGFFNGMIKGLEPYTVAGVIWYQADGNSGLYQEYPALIQALIKAWRREWNAELPFYYVEMNNMWEPQQQPVENGHNLGPTREAQEAALLLPKTDVVAAIDLGDAGAITNPHFWNKKPVGQRLANEALEQIYGLPLGEVHSPEFESFTVAGGKVRLKFRHAGGLRTRDHGPVKGFAIRGASGAWVWADGKIEGRDIVVWSSQVPAPAAVRYAWAANPVISIENGEGLPLRPFRTDKDAAP